MSVIDLERKLADREFTRHWRLARELKLRAIYADLSGDVAGVFIRVRGEVLAAFGVGGGVLIVSSAAHLMEEERDVTADQAALHADPRAGTAVRVFQLAEVRRLVEIHHENHRRHPDLYPATIMPPFAEAES
jgi:hypothetical protein